MKKIVLIISFITILILCTLSFFMTIYLTQTQSVKRIYSDIILANTENFYSCEELPTIDIVEKSFKENNDLIIQIKYISRTTGDETIFIEKDEAAQMGLDQWKCNGKAGVLIMVNSESERREIVKLIGKDFKGIPYRIINV